MTSILIQAVQFFASLSLLVLIHEFGHFITARMFGMRVDKFYLFFNPGFSLWKRKIGEVEYGIGWLPLGGYVSIYDNREPLYEREEELSKQLEEQKQNLKKAKRANSADVAAIEAEIERLKAEVEKVKEECRTLPPDKDEMRGKPAWQRLIVMIAGVVMNAILAIVIYSGILCHWGESYYHNDDMTYGYLYNEEAEALGFVDGDRIITIDGEAVGEVTNIIERLLIVDHDLEVMVEREDEQKALTLPLTELVAMRERGGHVGFFAPNNPFIIDSVVAESATEAGLMAGDKIIAINDTAVPNYETAQPLIAECANSAVAITVERAGSQTLTLDVPISEQGIGITRALILPRQKQYTLLESIPAGAKRAGAEIKSYWNQIKMMFKPETKLYKEMGGFIAIGSIFPDAWNWYAFWNITALISIILAVMNLLPIPVLDGGHVLFTLWEIITRRKPNEKVLIVLQNIGFWLLMALILYANGNDILKLFQ
jgi:regulator of sigma E protease